MESLDRVLRDFAHWTVSLHSDQSSLGRCIVMLKRREVKDFFDIRPNEKEELFIVMPALKDTLQHAFSPDHFKYAIDVDDTYGLTLDIIPIYVAAKTFAGITFDGKQQVVSDLTMNQIKQALKIPFAKHDIRTSGFQL